MIEPKIIAASTLASSALAFVFASSPAAAQSLLSPVADSVVGSAITGTNCNVAQYTNAAGVEVETGCGTTLAQANSGFGDGAGVFASAASSSTNSNTSGSATFEYYFSIVPNGVSGAPAVSPEGIGFTVGGTYSASSSFAYFLNPSGTASSIGGEVEVFGYAEDIYNASCGSGSACSVTGSPFSVGSSLTPSAAGVIELAAECQVLGVGTCSITVDPTITIDPAYAAYYSVVTDIAPVPLPAALPLLLSGLGGLGVLARRRKLSV